nr:MAG: hypothetical protein TU36_07900 [Vulcanisaeta sp. AZ3]
MNTFRKLSLIRIKEITMAVVSIDGEQHILINQETREVVKEVNRLLGLRRCSSCGRLTKAEELGYVEIINSKVTKALCNHCLTQLMKHLTCNIAT